MDDHHQGGASSHPPLWRQDAATLEHAMIAAGATAEGARYALRVFASDPSRRVQSGVGNVTVRFPSLKMGVSIQAESKGVELAGFLDLEWDTAVAGYWDQPDPIRVERTSGGRRSAHLATPDALVLYADHQLALIEYKPQDQLQRLATRYPDDWVTEQARWRFLPGERAAESLGIPFIVISSNELPKTRAQNLMQVLPYRSDTLSDEDLKVLKELLSYISTRGWVSLRDAKRLCGLENASPLYRLLAHRRIVTDLDRTLLVHEPEAMLFSSEANAKMFGTLPRSSQILGKLDIVDLTKLQGSWLLIDDEPHLIASISGSEARLIPTGTGRTFSLGLTELRTWLMAGKAKLTENSAVERISQIKLPIEGVSPSAMQTALLRLEAVQGYLSGSLHDPSRNERRWISAYQTAMSAHGSGLVGLIPKTHLRGNRGSRLTDEQTALLEECSTRFKHRTAPSRSSVYSQYRATCGERKTEPVSRYTFDRWLMQLDPTDVARARGGRRAANAVRPTASHEHREIRTVRAWQRAHLDHTELDVQLISHVTGHPLGRAWLTILVDAFSQMVLAFWLQFRPPSHVAAMAVVRDCVRRWGRLPEAITTDRGAEFESTYYETLLAFLSVTKLSRPPGNPRFGAEAESAFRSFNQLFLHRLPGNTQNDKHGRSTSSSTKGASHASLSLDELYLGLDEFLFGTYARRPKESLAASPRELFDASIAQQGTASIYVVSYNESFLSLSAPQAPRPLYKIDARQGICVLRRHFWAEEFRQPKWTDARVPVRIEVFDRSIVYALVDSTWVTCRSSDYSQLQTRNDVWRMIDSIDYRARQDAIGPQRQASDLQLGQALLEHAHPRPPVDLTRAPSPGLEPLMKPTVAASSRPRSHEMRADPADIFGALREVEIDSLPIHVEE